MGYKISETLSWKNIQGQVLVIDPRGSKQAHELSPMGSFIWCEISKGNSKTEILKKLSQQYTNKEPEEISQDLDQYFNKLESLKLIFHDSI